MRIYVKVVANSNQQKVEKISAGDYKIWVKAVPEKGKANQELIKILADYFQVNKSDIEIVAGKTSSKKLVDIRL